MSILVFSFIEVSLAPHNVTRCSPLHHPQPSTVLSMSIFLPVMSPPSRILPQRAWAAAVPTLLSHEMLTKLLTASPLQGTQFLPASPLERFFACVHLRRHMQRVIQSETSVSIGCWFCLCMMMLLAV